MKSGKLFLADKSQKTQNIQLELLTVSIFGMIQNLTTTLKRSKSGIWKYYNVFSRIHKNKGYSVKKTSFLFIWSYLPEDLQYLPEPLQQIFSGWRCPKKVSQTQKRRRPQKWRQPQKWRPSEKLSLPPQKKIDPHSKEYYLNFLLMTSPLDSHSATDVTPDILSGVRMYI